MRLRAPGMIMPQCDLILFEVAFLFKLAYMVISGGQFSCSLGMRGCVNVKYLEWQILSCPLSYVVHEASCSTDDNANVKNPEKIADVVHGWSLRTYKMCLKLRCQTHQQLKLGRPPKLVWNFQNKSVHINAWVEIISLHCDNAILCSKHGKEGLHVFYPHLAHIRLLYREIRLS